MRIRNAVLAVAATVAAGSAIAAPAMAQDYRPGFVRVYERGYAPPYYRPYFAPHRYWFRHDFYRDPYHYGYGYRHW
jgi:hypothetical protein